jgi:hypothetical protein
LTPLAVVIYTHTGHNVGEWKEAFETRG